jgi:hypothetical protein
MQSMNIISKKLVMIGDGVVYDPSNIIKLPAGSRSVGEYIYVSDVDDIRADTLVSFNTYDGFSVCILFDHVFVMARVLTTSS